MSQWTHILGIIRFDSMAANVWPEPPQKTKVLKDEVKFIHNLFQKGDTVSGSERPIEIQTILTNRGPTVVITGDLRDFGKKDLPKIVNWANAIIKVINKEKKKYPTLLRDAFINCNVEPNESFVIVLNDAGVFEIKNLREESV